MDVSAGPATVATVRPSPPAPPRWAHPVQKAPERKCYRVIRMFRQRGTFEFEDIGAFVEAGNALRMLDREIGKARVLDPNGKVYSDNWQPIETREG